MKAGLAFLTVILGACASNDNFDWTQKNPYAGFEGVPQEKYAAPKSSIKLDLVFSSNLFGETEPCGCASGPKGGLDRRLNYLRSTPQFGDRIILDAGNALFAGERLDPSKVELLQKRAEAILYSAGVMGFRAMNIGHLDLSAGVEFLERNAKKYKSPYVSANLRWGTSAASWYSDFLDVSIGDTNLRVTGLMAGRQDLASPYSVESWEKALKRVAADAKKFSLLIVLSDLGRIEDERILAQDWGVPVIVIGSGDLNSLDRPLVKNRNLFVQPQFRGQQWGRLTMNFVPNAQGWFNLGQAAELSSQWARLKEESAVIASRESGPERNSELRRQSAAALELISQGQGSGEARSAFTYDLIDVGQKFVKRNELTDKMREVAD